MPASRDHWGKHATTHISWLALALFFLLNRLGRWTWHVEQQLHVLDVCASDIRNTGDQGPHVLVRVGGKEQGHLAPFEPEVQVRLRRKDGSGQSQSTARAYRVPWARNGRVPTAATPAFVLAGSQPSGQPKKKLAL